METTATPGADGVDKDAHSGVHLLSNGEAVTAPDSGAVLLSVDTLMQLFAAAMPINRDASALTIGSRAGPARKRAPLTRRAHRHHIVARHTPTGQPGDDTLEAKPIAPMSWMQRLRRVFAIDISTCSRCGGEVRVIAAITEQALIARILEHRAKGDEPGGGARAPPGAALHERLRARSRFAHRSRPQCPVAGHARRRAGEVGLGRAQM